MCITIVGEAHARPKLGREGQAEGVGGWGGIYRVRVLDYSGCPPLPVDLEGEGLGGNA